MPARIYPNFETPFAGFAVPAGSGFALARVVEAHPALLPLLDFCAVDPIQMALEVGMVYPYEEDGADDLSDIDFGPPEWFEPVAGLAALASAAASVQDDPQSLAAALYDPSVTPAAVLADLEALTQALQLAQQHETRFHFVQASP